MDHLLGPDFLTLSNASSSSSSSSSSAAAPHSGSTEPPLYPSADQPPFQSDAASLFASTEDGAVSGDHFDDDVGAIQQQQQQMKMSLDGLRKKLAAFCFAAYQFGQACGQRMQKERDADMANKALWSFVKELRPASVVCADGSFIKFTYEYLSAQLNESNYQRFYALTKELQHFIPSAYFSLYFRQIVTQYSLVHYLLSTSEQYESNPDLLYSMLQLVMQTTHQSPCPLYPTSLAVLREISIFIGTSLVSCVQQQQQQNQQQKDHSMPVLLDFAALDIEHDAAKKQVQHTQVALVQRILQLIVAHNTGTFAAPLFQPSLHDAINLRLLSILFPENLKKLIQSGPTAQGAGASHLKEEEYLHILNQIPFKEMNADNVSSTELRECVLAPIQIALNALDSRTHFRVIVRLCNILVACIEVQPSLALEGLTILTRSAWPCKMISIPSLFHFPWRLVEPNVLELAFRELYHLYNRDISSLSLSEKETHQNDFVNKYLIPHQATIQQVYDVDNNLRTTNGNYAFPIVGIFKLLGEYHLRRTLYLQYKQGGSVKISEINQTMYANSQSALAKTVVSELFALAYKSGTTIPAHLPLLSKLRSESTALLRDFAQRLPMTITYFLEEIINELHFLQRTQPQAVDTLITLLASCALDQWIVFEKELNLLSILLLGRVPQPQGRPPVKDLDVAARRIGLMLFERTLWNKQTSSIRFKTLNMLLENTSDRMMAEWVLRILVGPMGIKLTHVDTVADAEQFLELSRRGVQDNLRTSVQILVSIGICEAQMLAAQEQKLRQQPQQFESPVAREEDVVLEFDDSFNNYFDSRHLGQTSKAPVQPLPLSNTQQDAYEGLRDSWIASERQYQIVDKIRALANAADVPTTSAASSTSTILMSAILARFVHVVSRLRPEERKLFVAPLGPVLSKHIARSESNRLEIRNLISGAPGDTRDQILMAWTQLLVVGIADHDASSQLMDMIISREFQERRSIQPIIGAFETHLFTRAAIFSFLAKNRIWTAWIAAICYEPKIPPLEEPRAQSDSLFLTGGQGERVLNAQSESALWICADCAIKLSQSKFSLLFWERFFELYFMVMDGYGQADIFPQFLRERYNKHFTTIARQYEDKNKEVYNLFYAFTTWSNDVIPGGGKFLKDSMITMLFADDGAFRGVAVPPAPSPQIVPPPPPVMVQAQAQGQPAFVPKSAKDLLAQPVPLPKTSLGNNTATFRILVDRTRKLMHIPASKLQVSPDLSSSLMSTGSLLEFNDPWAIPPSATTAQSAAISPQSYDSDNENELREGEHAEEDDDASCYKLATDIIKQIECYRTCLADWKKEDDEHATQSRSVYINVPSKSVAVLTSHIGERVQTEFPVTHIQFSDPDIMNKLVRNRQRFHAIQKSAHETVERLAFLSFLMKRCVNELLNKVSTSNNRNAVSAYRIKSRRLFFTLFRRMMDLEFSSQHLVLVWKYNAKNLGRLGGIPCIALSSSAQKRLLSDILASPPIPGQILNPVPPTVPPPSPPQNNPNAVVFQQLPNPAQLGTPQVTHQQAFAPPGQPQIQPIQQNIMPPMPMGGDPSFRTSGYPVMYTNQPMGMYPPQPLQQPQAAMPRLQAQVASFPPIAQPQPQPLPQQQPQPPPQQQQQQQQQPQQQSPAKLWSVDRTVLFSQAVNPSCLIDRNLTSQFIELLEVLTSRTNQLSKDELRALVKCFSIERLFGSFKNLPLGSRFSGQEETKRVLAVLQSALCRDDLVNVLGTPMLGQCAELAFPSEWTLLLRLILACCKTGNCKSSFWYQVFTSNASQLGQIDTDQAMEWISIINQSQPLPDDALHASISLTKAFILQTQMGVFIQRCPLSAPPIVLIVQFFTTCLAHTSQLNSHHLQQQEHPNKIRPSEQTFIHLVSVLHSILNEVPLMIDLVWDMYFGNLLPFAVGSSTGSENCRATLTRFMKSLDWAHASFHEGKQGALNGASSATIMDSIYQAIPHDPDTVCHLFNAMDWHFVLESTDSDCKCCLLKIYLDVNVLSPELIPKYIKDAIDVETALSNPGPGSPAVVDSVQQQPNQPDAAQQRSVWLDIRPEDYATHFNGNVLSRVVVSGIARNDPTPQLVKNAFLLNEIGYSTGHELIATACAREIKSIMFLMVQAPSANDSACGIWMLPFAEHKSFLINIIIPLTMRYGTHPLVQLLFSCLQDCTRGTQPVLVSRKDGKFASGNQSVQLFKNVPLFQLNMVKDNRIRFKEMNDFCTQFEGIISHFCKSAPENLCIEMLNSIPLMVDDFSILCDCLEDILHAYLKATEMASPRERAAASLSLPLSMAPYSERYRNFTNVIIERSCNVLLTVVIEQLLSRTKRQAQSNYTSAYPMLESSSSSSSSSNETLSQTHLYACDIVLRARPHAANDFDIVYPYFLFLELIESDIFNIDSPEFVERYNSFDEILTFLGTRHTKNELNLTSKFKLRHITNVLSGITVTPATSLACRAIGLYAQKLVRAKLRMSNHSTSTLLGKSKEDNKASKIDRILRLKDNKVFKDYNLFFNEIAFTMSDGCEIDQFRHIVIEHLFPLCPYLEKV